MSSTLASIENALVEAVQALESDGAPLLATVKGQGVRDRKGLLATLSRERLPAAYVVLTGRDAGEKPYRPAGDVAVSVFYATGSERNDTDARVGGVDVIGMYTIAEAALLALNGLELGDQRQLLLVEERSIAGEGSLVVWEQQYEVRRVAPTGLPGFEGESLVGDRSRVEMEVGQLDRARSTFAFPGINGVFERVLGTRERPIVWRGQLRAEHDWALSVLESSIEQKVRAGVPGNINDPAGRTFEQCVPKAFRRRGMRRRDAVTDEVYQEFELEFVQLMG